jgi:muramoyltetrapeptide carboxypeptidase
MHDKKLIRPPSLKPGDKVGIVAPARKVSREEMAPAIEMMASWGYEIVEGKHLYGSHNQFSGTDQERVSDLQAMLDNPGIKAVFCARGGYGSARVIDRLDFSAFRKSPKWIVGYSDITVFHSHIPGHFGIEALHACMPINFPGDRKMNESLNSLKRILEGEDVSYAIPPHEFNRNGISNGQLCGGNLSMLYSLSGTASDINTEGKILFLEDLDEYLYHIDRIMMNLKRSGKLEKLAGLVVGGMNDMNDNEIPFGKTAYEIISGAVSEYTYPVLFDFPAGHIPDNRALVMGGKYELCVDKKSSFRLL